MTEFITLDWKNSIIQSEFSGGGGKTKKLKRNRLITVNVISISLLTIYIIKIRNRTLKRK